MTTEKPAAPLSTSDGARCYIAHFFAREMRRHDFTTYIATELAADFACALAQYLAARQPVGAAEQLDRALGETIDQRDRYHEVADDLAGHIERITGVEIGEHSSVNCPWQNAIEAAEGYTPAQGIDLGQQQDAVRWRAIAPLLSVEWDEDEQLKRWTWIDFKGDAPAIPSPTRQEYASVDEAVDALIDQRDAAPGAGSRTDHLLDRRNRLMNSYGNGDREDAALDEQIAKIDAELAGSQRDVATGVGNG